MKKNKIILLTSLALISSIPFTITSCNDTNINIKLSIKTLSKTTLNVGESLNIEFDYEGIDDVTSIKLVSVDETVVSVKNHTIKALKEGFSYIYAECGNITTDKIKIEVEKVDETIKLNIETPTSTSYL